MASPSAGEPRGGSAQKNRADGSRTTRLRLTWTLGILLAVALGAVGIAAQQQPNASNEFAPGPTGAAEGSPPASDAEQEQGPELSQLARRDPADAAAKGELDAPVVIIEYADFRCAYCAVFANEVLPTVMTEYVDTGLVRFEWRDAPVLGKTSPDAAIAAHAAGAQGLFWEYAGALYATAPTGGTVWDQAAVTAVAESIPGLDLAAFTLALDDPAHARRVAADLQETQAIGVSGTPTFIVGNTPVQGAQPLEVFREVIEQELVAAQQ
ncbi:thioredoxin domain-containing protein [Homoserinimonas sp. OAct 916]|uniref:DsbA family protein n=1 Tax=Homoserinimonas sp. OAct 916 TaxID=2211450 RepID=UPI0013006BA7|nr:thioredoxin domain-containing protein [Homoserinimonas sp. OAct 916]